MNSTATAAGSAPAPKSLIARFIGIITAPKDTFVSVAAFPKWVTLLAISAVLIAFFAALPMTTAPGRQAAIDQQVQQRKAFGIETDDAQYAQIERMSKINTYHVKLFSDYLAKLKATPDGDGSLLDHITILYGAGISNSNRHSGDNLPILLAGGGAGRIKGGRHIKYTGKPSMANLLVTLMDKMDVPVDHMGASTGKLPIDALAV